MSLTDSNYEFGYVDRLEQNHLSLSCSFHNWSLAKVAQLKGIIYV